MLGGKFSSGIRDHVKTLKEWYGASISGNETLADVYAKFSTGELDGRALSPDYETVVAEVRVGKNTSATITQVQP